MNVLIVSTHQSIAQTIVRLIHRIEGWNASVALSLNDALAHCYAKRYEVILIGSGITQSSENVLKLHLEILKNNTPIVKHYGGGAGLLYAEIHQALADR